MPILKVDFKRLVKLLNSEPIFLTEPIFSKPEQESSGLYIKTKNEFNK